MFSQRTVWVSGSVAQQKCLSHNIVSDEGFATLSFTFRFLVSKRLEVSLYLNEKYQISAAYKKGPLEAVLQIDTGFPEKYYQAWVGLFRFIFTVCVGWRFGNAFFTFMRKTQRILFSNSFHCVHGKRFVLLSKV